MRCIEIGVHAEDQIQVRRLTLTWDVLKFVGGINGLISGVQININMRCIEILLMAQKNYPQQD